MAQLEAQPPCASGGALSAAATPPAPLPHTAAAALRSREDLERLELQALSQRAVLSATQLREDLDSMRVRCRL